jgi:GABA(A) receptor-associated protein
MSFKQEVSFQNRLEESTRVLAKYPDRRPVICEKVLNKSTFPSNDKKNILFHITLLWLNLFMLFEKE